MTLRGEIDALAGRVGAEIKAVRSEILDLGNGPDGVGGGGSSAVRTQAELATALAAGGDVVVDSGVTIALTSTQTISKPTRLVGGTFTRASGEAFRITSSNVELSGITITGGAGASGGSYDQNQKLVRAVGTTGNRLTGINIHDCAFRQSRGDCVWLDWCDGARVSGNTMRRFLYSGVMVISGIRCRIADNDIADGPLTGSVVNTYGIAVTDADNTVAARSTDCAVTGNVVHLIDWEGIDTHGGDSIVITGNVVTACPRGIALVTGNTSRVTAPQRCVVTGNRIDGSGMRKSAREAIHLGGIPGNIADAVITGNIVDNNGTAFILDYYDRGKTYVGANSEPHIPWTTLPLAGTFRSGALGIPQYMLDGSMVYLRGSIIRNSSGKTPDADITGALPSALRPSQWTLVAVTRMSVSASSSAATAHLVINDAGQLRLIYAGDSTNEWNWMLTGSYRVP